jgi:hypothetical protein
MGKNILDRNSYFGKFKDVVLAKFGEEGNEIWKQAGEISARLLSENKNAVKDAKTVAYPMAGIYLALQKKVSKEEARKLMMDYAPSAGEAAKQRMAKLTGFPGLPKLIWLNREAIMKSAGSEKKGYRSKIIEVSKESVTMHVYSCPIHETLKELGMEEIAPVMCAIDKISTTGIRGVCYHRTKAVAEGDEYCDYYITRKV